MPGGDRTGPDGLGPMTGRRLGYCVTGTRPWFVNQGYGPGRQFRGGRGRGKGLGTGRIPHGMTARTDPPDDVEKADLRNRIQMLQEELSSLQRRFDDTREID